MPLLAITTFPDLECARTIGAILVQEKLAACVNILPALESIYHWQGSLERSQETLALVKTTAEAWPALERRLRELHPYECPELIALSITHGTAPYLQWLIANCSSKAVADGGPSTAKPQT